MNSPLWRANVSPDVLEQRRELEREIQAWQYRRNEEATTVNWRFTTADARIKLKRLYPSLEPRKRISKKSNIAKKG